VEIALHVRGARRAPRNLRLTQQEVQHRADAARHHEAESDPEARAHGPPRGVLTDVTYHQKVERGQQTPGNIEVDAEAERRMMILLAGKTIQK